MTNRLAALGLLSGFLAVFSGCPAKPDPADGGGVDSGVASGDDAGLVRIIFSDDRQAALLVPAGATDRRMEITLRAEQIDGGRRFVLEPSGLVLSKPAVLVTTPSVSSPDAGVLAWNTATWRLTSADGTTTLV